MLSRIVVLAGFTARSQAYLQALEQAQVGSVSVLAYGPLPQADAARPSRATPAPRQLHDIALPDLCVPIEATCKRAGWELLHCADQDIGSRALRAILQACAPSLVIFSGYGGQIVGRQLLDMDAPFLHVHAGTLPDYRGSTTTYYSMLERGDCAASAFLLRAGIDTGPVIAQRHYPCPTRGMDVDRLWDAAIRADLLVHAVTLLGQHGTAVAVEQEPGSGHTYYVVHPVLKHLALLSLPAADDDERARADLASQHAA